MTEQNEKPCNECNNTGYICDDCGSGDGLCTCEDGPVNLTVCTACLPSRPVARVKVASKSKRKASRMTEGRTCAEKAERDG